MRTLEVRRLGIVPYADGLALQQQLVDDRRAGRIGDTLLLLQHPHVLTIGVRKDGHQHVLATPERLQALGVELHETGRGGDVTYHGPGQIVGYPILDLNPDRRDVHRYVRDLEDVMMRVCVAHGLTADRIAGRSGTWIMSAQDGPEKIGAIGVRVSRWITSHGFAFNVNTDLAYFGLIVPCGISDRGVTSLQKATGRTHDLPAVEDQLTAAFADVFGRQPIPG